MVVLLHAQVDHIQALHWWCLSCIWNACIHPDRYNSLNYFDPSRGFMIKLSSQIQALKNKICTVFNLIDVHIIGMFSN